MTDILFANSEYIKERSVIDENVDNKYLLVTIQKVQDTHIKQILGTALYDQLITAVDTSTFTALETTLIENYVQPSILYWVQYEVSPFLLYKLTNKSIVNKNSDNSSAINTSELDRIMDNFSNTAQWYDKQMIKYLLENESSYPNYVNPGTGVDTIYPVGTTYDSGIWTGGYNKFPRGIDIDFGRINNL